MKFTDLFHITKGTRVVLIITLCICGSAIAVAAIYYRSLNRADDPRMIPVRTLLQQADSASARLKAPEAQILLDSARGLVEAIPIYRDSWENGVILNNAASAWLMAALYDSTLPANEKTRMLEIVLRYTDSSLGVYNRWMDQWGSLTEETILDRILPGFNEGDMALNGYSTVKLARHRTRQILEAKIETPRRISVVLTNRGTSFRHLSQLDSARYCFEQALQIWPENQAAKSNLSVLNGGKPTKPSLLKTLFPPDKNQKIK